MIPAERVERAQNTIDGLTALANATTSAGDTNITDAVTTLIDGYNRGGGIKKAEGVFTLTISNAGVTINHGLSAKQVCVVISPNSDTISTDASYRVISAWFTNVAHLLPSISVLTHEGSTLDTGTATIAFGAELIVGANGTSFSVQTCSCAKALINQYVTPSEDGNTVFVKGSNTSRLFQSGVEYKWTVYGLD